jgi:hypothetical protein
MQESDQKLTLLLRASDAKIHSMESWNEEVGNRHCLSGFRRVRKREF